MNFADFLHKKVIRKPSVEDKTPIIYYGGKTRDADWIIKQFPPHETFVDVFGGGGAVTFRKGPSNVDVYNDIGNVSLWMQCLRDHGEELYHALTLTPFGREEFERCRKLVDVTLENYKNTFSTQSYVEWARMWYVVVLQGYEHTEDSDSWRVAKQVNAAAPIASHVDDLPKFIERLRRGIHVEHLDFERCLELYDSVNTLAYCDPPYLPVSRKSLNTYKHEMPESEHVRMLKAVVRFKGQVIVSGYPSELYDTHLTGWRKVTKVAKSAIHNSSTDDPGEREEVLWIKEHAHGLWTSANVSGVWMEKAHQPEPVHIRRR